MHVEEDLLNRILNAWPSEGQVLKSVGKAPELSGVSNRRPRVGGNLGLRVHWRRAGLAVHHSSTLENVESILALGEEEVVGALLYGDPQEVM